MNSIYSSECIIVQCISLITLLLTDIRNTHMSVCVWKIDFGIHYSLDKGVGGDRGSTLGFKCRAKLHSGFLRNTCFSRLQENWVLMCFSSTWITILAWMSFWHWGTTKYTTKHFFIHHRTDIVKQKQLFCDTHLGYLELFLLFIKPQK